MRFGADSITWQVVVRQQIGGEVGAKLIFPLNRTLDPRCIMPSCAQVLAAESGRQLVSLDGLVNRQPKVR